MKSLLRKLFALTAASAAFLPLQVQSYSDACCDFGCYDTCCDYTDRFWLEADYLYWQVQDSPKTIPLVIEQPVPNGPFDVVLGNEKLKNDWHSGGRFAVGYWFDECKNLGAELNYFFLGTNSKHSHVASNAEGAPRLRVPFFNVTTGLPDSVALATPDIFRGNASLKISNSMQNAEANMVIAMPAYDCSNFRIIAGFRYWNFNEKLTFTTESPFIPTNSIYNNRDKFRTQNNFYGGQIGGSFNQRYCSLCFNITGKVAVGAMCQESQIDGLFVTNEFTGEVQSFLGGYFAQPSNIGKHKKTRISVIPEVDINMGYQITDCFCVHVGYTFLYATNVLRAPKQMSSAINPTQSANLEFNPNPVLVGEPVPTGKLKSSSLWAQGVNVGIDFTF